MRLEEIGFYTLSDARAKGVSWTSDLIRCELILTDACNFRCPYCRGVAEPFQGSLSLDEAKDVVRLWAGGNIRNVRFSGGEPTVWPWLEDLVRYTASVPSIERIAVSTNGSASIAAYQRLLDAGVNDFSISLDACCSATADRMSGSTGKFDAIRESIKYLSERTYVSVGVVLNGDNDAELKGIVEFAVGLGVSDVRIITAAQSNHGVDFDVDPRRRPILRYRLDNVKKGKPMRGIGDGDCGKCHLVKDDMVILKGHHFPCVIYMREQGNPIGSIRGKSLAEIRSERKAWFDATDTRLDAICSKNCLDVCVEHNNRVRELADE